MTDNHSGNMIEMPASASQHLEPLKGTEGGGRRGLRDEMLIACDLIF